MNSWKSEDIFLYWSGTYLYSVVNRFKYLLYTKFNHVILFLFWKLFFELFTISVFWRWYLFLALVQSESPLQYMNIYFIFHIEVHHFDCVILVCTIFLILLVFFVFLYKSLKKKSKSMLNNRKFMVIMFKFKGS